MNGKKELWVLDTLLYVEHIVVGKVLENWELCMLYTMEEMVLWSSGKKSCSGSINDDDEDDQAKTDASSTMKNQCMVTWLFKDIYYQRKQYYF
jgi:hypothetical protein